MCSHVMRLLNEYDVMLEGILLKPNMCLPGEAAAGDSTGRAPVFIHAARRCVLAPLCAAFLALCAVFPYTPISPLLHPR